MRTHSPFHATDGAAAPWAVPPGTVGRAQGRAAVAVITGLLAFAVLQFAAAAAFELWLPGAIDPDYGARLQDLRQGRAADPSRTRTVVMLGSSRTYYALRPKVVEGPLRDQLSRPVSVVNFGFSGAGGTSELLTWRRLRWDGVRPDLLLVEVWPQSFMDGFVVGDLGEERLPTSRLRWIDLSLLRRYGVARPHQNRDVMLAEIDPLFSRRLWMVNALSPRLLPSYGEGRSPLLERLAPTPFDQMSAEGVAQYREGARRNVRPYVGGLQIGGRSYQALRELLRGCREAGVPVALVVLPEGPEYRSWYAAGTWRRFEDWLAQVGREYDVALINAREWIGEDDFADSYHLLPPGAAKFSERLGREYLLPWLRRPPCKGGPGHFEGSS